MPRFRVMFGADQFVGTFDGNGATPEESAQIAVTLAARNHGQTGRYTAVRVNAGDAFDVTFGNQPVTVTPVVDPGNR